MHITSRHRSLAFRKTRSAKNAMSPDTIGSGNIAFPWAAPAHSSGNGAARFYSVIFVASIGPGPCRIQSRAGRVLMALTDAAVHEVSMEQ